MRVLSGFAVIFVVGLAITLVVAWLHSRATKARRTPDDLAVKRSREFFLIADMAVDAIERILAEDRTRLFLTEDEQIDLKTIVVRHNQALNK